MKTLKGLPSAGEFAISTVWGRQLTREQRDRVLADTRDRVFSKGTTVCQVGSPVQYWKGVIEGLVKMSVVSPEGRTSTFTGLAAGAWFGEGPVLRSNTWDFDGVAMRETRLALVPRETFEWLLSVSPAFNRYVIQQLNERLAQFLSIVEAERLEVAETRVARCLGWLFNPVLYPGAGSRLDLSQEEIGYLSGVSRQHVNRALRQMQDAGVLLVEYGGIRVLDQDGLQSFRRAPAKDTAS
ncbi:MAG: Crp/Fnr family transcriptional regulator [Polaromonas sp.]|nr:Crp/Fnr family transcriptional regulator [Polaromonas sp.]